MQQGAGERRLGAGAQAAVGRDDIGQAGRQRGVQRPDPRLRLCALTCEMQRNDLAQVGRRHVADQVRHAVQRHRLAERHAVPERLEQGCGDARHMPLAGNRQQPDVMADQPAVQVAEPGGAGTVLVTQHQGQQRREGGLDLLHLPAGLQLGRPCCGRQRHQRPVMPDQVAARVTDPLEQDRPCLGGQAVAQHRRLRKRRRQRLVQQRIEFALHDRGQSGIGRHGVGNKKMDHGPGQGLQPERHGLQALREVLPLRLGLPMRRCGQQAVAGDIPAGSRAVLVPEHQDP